MNPLEILTESATELKSTFDQLIGVVAPFVEAISPSTMALVNQAFRDLQATIGSAFVPAFQILAETFRNFGGIILPLMQRLQPIITQLAQAFSTLAQEVLRQLVTQLQILVPVIDVLASALAQLVKFYSDLMSIGTALYQAFATIISSFLGTDTAQIKDIFKSLFDSMRVVIKQLILFGATLATVAGFRNQVKIFADSLAGIIKERDNPAQGLKGAAQNAHIGGIGEITQKIQLASAIAAGGAGNNENKSDTEWLKDIAKSVAKVADDQKSFAQALKDWWDGAINDINNSVSKFVDKIIDAFKSVGNSLTDAWKSIRPSWL
jgi:hypothetical protein